MQSDDFRKTSRWRIGALAFCVLALPASAQVDDASEWGDGYRVGDFGRVRFEEHGALLIRAGASGPATEEVGPNVPLFPGDTIRTDPDQRVEVQLAQGSLVRIDRRSDVTFLALPDPYAELQDHAVLQIAGGAVRLDAEVAAGEEFRLDTPAASIHLLGDADLRVEVDDRGRTRVFSRRGVVEVVGAGGSVILRGGMRTEVEPGALPLDPWGFNTFAEDSFDRWVQDRDAVYREGVPLHAGAKRAYDDLPDEVRPYYGELDHYGSWVYTAELGWVWQPRDVERDWRPYHHGYWDYGPHGYIWVASEPWGWAPYHYGRWNWVSGFGWCWIPGRVFAGAWVSWSWGPVYVGWSPLDCWGYPAFRATVYHGYYDPYAWTFIEAHHIAYHDYSHHFVAWDRLGNHAQRAAVVTRPPKVSPRELAGSPEARARAGREALEDRTRRVAARGTGPDATRATAATRFSDLEDRWIRRDGGAQGRTRSAAASSAAATRALPSYPRATAPSASTRSTRPSAGGETARPVPSRTGASGAAATPAQPDRRTSSGVDRARPAPAPPTSAGRSPGEAPSRTQVRTSQPEPQQRLRDLYRRLARPPQTARPPATSRGEASPAPSAGDSSSRSRSTPSRARPQAQPKRETPAPRTAAPQPRPAPSGSRSGAQARPSGSRSGSSRSGSSSGRKKTDSGKRRGGG